MFIDRTMELQWPIVGFLIDLHHLVLGHSSSSWKMFQWNYHKYILFSVMGFNKIILGTNHPSIDPTNVAFYIRWCNAPSLLY